MGIMDALGGFFGLPQAKQGLQKMGNPLDWGKSQSDPSKARLEGGDQMRGYLWQQLGGVGGRQAPQVRASQLDGGMQADARARSMGLADQLARVGSGQDAGAGELATRRSFAQALAAQQAQQRMARGGNAALAARSAATNAANMGVNAAGMGREAALQDQMASRGLLGQLLGQTRGQDIDVASQNAQLSQQGSLANQAASLQQMGMNDQAIATYLSQLYGISAAEMQARLAQEAGDMAQTGILPGLLQQAGGIGAAIAGR